jgi:hypothetical protein
MRLMGLFGDHWPFRGGGMKEAKPSKMAIPPGMFLLGLALLAIIIMLCWL